MVHEKRNEKQEKNFNIRVNEAAEKKVEELKVETVRNIEAEHQQKVAWVEAILSKIGKIAILAILLLSVILLFTHCENKLRDENKAIKQQLEHVLTGTYKTKTGINLYDEERQPKIQFGMQQQLMIGEVFYVVENDGEWCRIQLKKEWLSGKDETYCILASDLTNAVREEVDFS